MGGTSIFLNIAGPDTPGGREVRRELADARGASRITILNGHARTWNARSGGGAFSLKWAPRGRIRYRVDDGVRLVRPDGMMLLNRGQPYEMDFEAAGESFCLFFSDDVVAQAGGARGLGEFPNPVFRPGFADEVARLRTELSAAETPPDDLEARLLLILADAVGAARRHRGEAERLPAAKASTRRHLQSRLEVARALIEAGEGGELDQVARAAGLSKFHLVRLFRAAFGTTPMKHAEGVRLDRAAEVLREGTLLIEEVGFRAGYDSASAFGRAFRRRFGTSPRAWRRAART
jgi:AraC family transcriptional regulator